MRAMASGHGPIWRLCQWARLIVAGRPQSAHLGRMVPREASKAPLTPCELQWQHQIASRPAGAEHSAPTRLLSRLRIHQQAPNTLLLPKCTPAMAELLDPAAAILHAAAQQQYHPAAVVPALLHLWMAGILWQPACAKLCRILSHQLEVWPLLVLPLQLFFRQHSLQLRSDLASCPLHLLAEVQAASPPAGACPQGIHIEHTCSPLG
mmetsp:Transcript_9998/g.22381  ORF Transcript_9998/g.22381 Transcript_9998/m.22381 type:complete len:207 (+) Transcript_9998:1569-2189(+)